MGLLTLVSLTLSVKEVHFTYPFFIKDIYKLRLRPSYLLSPSLKNVNLTEAAIRVFDTL